MSHSPDLKPLLFSQPLASSHVLRSRGTARRLLPHLRGRERRLQTGHHLQVRGLDGLLDAARGDAAQPHVKPEGHIRGHEHISRFQMRSD